MPSISGGLGEHGRTCQLIKLFIWFGSIDTFLFLRLKDKNEFCSSWHWEKCLILSNNSVFLCSIKKYCHRHNMQSTCLQSQVGWMNMADPVDLSSYSFVLDLFILFCFYVWKEKMIFLLILALRKRLNSVLQLIPSLLNLKIL